MSGAFVDQRSNHGRRNSPQPEHRLLVAGWRSAAGDPGLTKSWDGIAGIGSSVPADSGWIFRLQPAGQLLGTAPNPPGSDILPGRLEKVKAAGISGGLDRSPGGRLDLLV